MDNTKTDPVKEQTTPVEYSNEDLRKESMKDIASNTEIPKEEVKPVVEETPKIDPEELAKRTADETAKRILADQEEQRTKDQIVETQLKTEEEKHQEYADEFAKEHGRNPTWTEVAQEMKRQAKEEVLQTLDERQLKQKEQEETTRKTEEEDTKRGWYLINNEMNDLYNNNMLTRIKDPKNPSDQGLLERNALLTQMAEENQRRRTANQPIITSVTQFHQFYFKRPNAQPPGANAPILGNQRSSTTPSEEQNYSYKDLKKPWSFLGRK